MRGDYTILKIKENLAFFCLFVSLSIDGAFLLLLLSHLYTLINFNEKKKQFNSINT